MKNIDLIDGLNEHHYGTDPRSIATEYEVASAYALGKISQAVEIL